MKENIFIRMPFDRHGHLRELETLLPFIFKYTARQFWGMVAMPNLSNPITTWQQAKIYFDQIMYTAQMNRFYDFIPSMTAYLTDNTNPHNIEEGFKRGIWKAAKLYPFGATTNSDKGVTKLEKIFPTLEVMQNIEMPLLVHPETDVSRHEILFEDRERVFTEESLTQIHKTFPASIISVEHISTIEAAQFVESCPNNVVGTITPQHIMYSHNALFDSGAPPYKPGMYAENMCLPILKWPKDVAYIKKAIMYGNKKYKFGAGTDTAPHDQLAKHDHCSRCGVFNAMHAVEFYAMVFDEMGMFENKEGVKVFEDFMSINNLWIYGLESSNKMIELRREEQMIPELVEGNIRPFKAGQKIPWTMHRV
jgi:dihydroorotase